MPFLVAVPFVVLITGLVVVALAAMQQSQSSGFVGWLEGVLGRAAVLVVPFAQAAIDLTRWITHKLGEHFAGIERLTVGWVASLYHYSARVITFGLSWPIELYRFATWLLDVELPRQLRAALSTVHGVTHVIVKQVPGITRTIVRLPKLSAATARNLIAAAVATYVAPYLAPLRWLRAHFHELTAVIPHTLPIPFGKTVDGIRARLRRLEKLTAGAAITAAVVAALTRLGLNWMRCTNVKRIGKANCALDTGLLDTLLLDGLAIVGAISVVEFAKELRVIEDEAVGVLGRLIREWPST